MKTILWLLIITGIISMLPFSFLYHYHSIRSSKDLDLNCIEFYFWIWGVISSIGAGCYLAYLKDKK